MVCNLKARIKDGSVVRRQCWIKLVLSNPLPVDEDLGPPKPNRMQNGIMHRFAPREIKLNSRQRWGRRGVERTAVRWDVVGTGDPISFLPVIECQQTDMKRCSNSVCGGLSTS